MKQLGTALLSICPVIIGLCNSKYLKINIQQIEKIIYLINWIITEIRYSKTDIKSMFYNISLNENFNNLEFLQYLKKYIEVEPFPKAWQLSIEEWNCHISTYDKELLKSLSNIIGASDSKGQILALKHIVARFEENLKLAQKNYSSKGKLSRSLGILIGAATFIIFI